MLLPTAATANTCPQENPIDAFALLILQYQWDAAELHRCGVCESDFQLLVMRLRAIIIDAGLIEEGW